MALTLLCRDLLDRVGGFNWFEHVGNPIESNDVARVFSWQDANVVCSKRESANVALECQNLLTERLCFEFPTRYRGQWNKLARLVMARWTPLLKQNVMPLLKKHKMSKDAVSAVKVDIGMACMELEYSDLIPPKYFKARLEWYSIGHFPCGWEGDFPEGSLVVY